MLMLWFTIFFSIVFIYILLLIWFNIIYPELRWDWSSIDIKKIKFPKNFIWGTATASHQVEGNCDNNNWYKWEQSLNQKGEPCISGSQKSGDACEHWSRYNQDINLIKKLGLNSYRLSIEWSKVEPNKGEINKDVILHYHKVIDALILNDIKPVITLHHFTEPVWFHDMGAFEKEENIDIFVSYSKFIFSEFSSKVKIWCTINEPSVYTTHGYFTGIFPPGKKNANIAVNVLKNLLQLHVEIYLALKDMPNGNDCQIGIVKNINQFEPYRRHSIMDWMVSLINNQFFNNSVINFFKTGVFKIRIPGLAWIKCYNKKAIGAMDFIGLNYYSHNHVKFKFDPKEFFELKFLSKDTMTDMPYTIYAEGFYRALHQISILNKPIIVTENGIADKKDKNRERYINEYLYALFRALEDGIDVRGYYYWSLLDNFEWAFGYDMKFGLYEVDFKTQKRTLRNGSKAYQKIVQKNN